ncbi:MAG: hypothetical protein AAGO57_09425, partial [Pseudomonadota bacterium]
PISLKISLNSCEIGSYCINSYTTWRELEAATAELLLNCRNPAATAKGDPNAKEGERLALGIGDLKPNSADMRALDSDLVRAQEWSRSLSGGGLRG